MWRWKVTLDQVTMILFGGNREKLSKVLSRTEYKVEDLDALQRINNFLSCHQLHPGRKPRKWCFSGVLVRKFSIHSVARMYVTVFWEAILTGNGRSCWNEIILEINPLLLSIKRWFYKIKWLLSEDSIRFERKSLHQSYPCSRHYRFLSLIGWLTHFQNVKTFHGLTVSQSTNQAKVCVTKWVRVALM